MINLRTHLVPLLGLLGATALSSLSGCAGASYEAQAPTESYVAEGRADQMIDEEVPGGVRRASTDVAIGADPNTYSDADPSALNDFREPLAPYGAWVDDSTYGTVWVPHASVVGSDFTPYSTAGHWTYADDWVWVSDYSWGWAPFHYGRWTYMGGRGWGWIPGRTYRGAWVSWRTGPVGYGYVGWAPLAPTWYWRNGYATGLYAVPPSPYVFCSTRHVFAPGVNSHIVRGPEVASIGAGTTPHTPASPTVDPHVRANPSVDGAGQTRSGAGPKPESLGIANNEIARMPTGHAGLSQAQAFAHPSTAVARGATPPATAVAYTEPRNMAPRTLTGASVATAPRFTPTTDLTRSAAPASPPPTSFNASPSSQSSFTPAMTGPRYQGIEPRSSASFAQAPRIMPPSTLPDISRTYAGGPSRAPTQMPSGASGPSYSRAPTFSQPSAPSISRAPYSPPSQSFSRPSYSPPSQSFSRPSYSPPSQSFSRPSYSPPSQSFSRPSYSPPSQSFSRPSSPSVSAPSFSRPSSPSFSRPSSPSMSRPSSPSISRPSVGRRR